MANNGMNKLRYEPCPGSMKSYTFAPGKTVTTSMATGKPSQARVNCQYCEWSGVGQVVRNRYGMPVSSDGEVVVPNHKPREAGWVKKWKAPDDHSRFLRRVIG